MQIHTGAQPLSCQAGVICRGSKVWSIRAAMRLTESCPRRPSRSAIT